MVGPAPAGKWLADFYAQLPQRIPAQVAKDPALAERLLRLVDARDAMLLPERAGADSWAFPQWRIQTPQSAPHLVVARRDAKTPDVRLSLDWQPIALTVDSGQDLTSVSIRVDFDDPAVIAIRRPGQEESLPPGAQSDVPLDADGLVVYEVRALKLATGRSTDQPVRLTVQAGDLQEILTLSCKLPQPNEIELRAECLLPREGATSRGLLGIQLRPFPNRTTTYQLALVNLAEEPKEVEVQLLAVRRPADARFGLGRLLDAQGNPYLSPDGDVVATAKAVSLPADGQPHAIAFDAAAPATAGGRGGSASGTQCSGWPRGGRRAAAPCCCCRARCDARHGVRDSKPEKPTRNMGALDRTPTKITARVPDGPQRLLGRHAPY